MTKRIIAYTLLFLVSAICVADNKADNNVFEMISFHTYYEQSKTLSNPKPKAPAKAPTVYSAGHTLYFVGRVRINRFKHDNHR